MIWPVQNFNGIHAGDRVIWTYGDRSVECTAESIDWLWNRVTFTLLLDNGGRYIGARVDEVEKVK